MGLHNSNATVRPRSLPRNKADFRTELLFSHQIMTTDVLMGFRSYSDMPILLVAV